MPRAGLTAEAVVERAAELLEQRPGDELTLAAVAESLGVRAPSLYKHVDGLPGLRRGLTLRAKTSLGAALAQATIGRSRADAIRSLALAYRRWAIEHPAQYPLTVPAPVEGDEADRAASAAAVEVITAVLAAYELVGDDAVDATRFFRATVHGFVSLESSGSFKLARDLERSYAALVESVVTALETWQVESPHD